MQSRGFGFVTFKHAPSVSAAVDAHYINIYGKKVEIKGAVPRSELPALEGSRPNSDTPIDSQTAMSANKAMDLDEADVLEVATPGSLCLPRKEVSQRNQMSSMAGPQQVSPSKSAPSSLSGLSSSRVTNVSSGSLSQSVTREASSESASSTSHGLPSANVSNVSRDTYSQSATRWGSSSIVQEGEPAWLNTFTEWLPEFLTRVPMRLKEGEWYPLSSLKGDYRAICGLELDHVSLSFEEPSDFVRSFAELCRMKNVPVGRGPANHMVLHPGLGGLDTVPSAHPAFCTSGTNYPVRQGTPTGELPSSSGETTSSTDRQPHASFGFRQRDFSSLRENGPSASYAAAAGYNAGVISTPNCGPLQTSITCAEGHSRSDSSNSTTVTSGMAITASQSRVSVPLVSFTRYNISSQFPRSV